MRTEHDKIEGDLIVSDLFNLHGMVTGSIVVEHSGVLNLYGMCCGSLLINPGGIAVIHGTVNRDIQNKGTVEVIGTVRGSVFSQGGHFEQSPNALIVGIIEA